MHHVGIVFIITPPFSPSALPGDTREGMEIWPIHVCQALSPHGKAAFGRPARIFEPWSFKFRSCNTIMDSCGIRCPKQF
jgi:hypothetical protein